MSHEKHPSQLKDLVLALRSMPTVEPPLDLSMRIMTNLPRHRGVLGRLEWALRQRVTSGPATCPRHTFIPATPAELGLVMLSAGIFFFCLSLVLLGQLHWIGLFTNQVGSFFPFVSVMNGAILLFFAGWRQLRTPSRTVSHRFSMVSAGFFFALAAVTGFTSTSSSILDLVGTWIGISGLTVLVFFVLLYKLSLASREERHANIPCSA